MSLAAVGTVALTLVHPSSTRQFSWPWILVLQGIWLAPLAALGLGLATQPNWRRPERGLLAGLILLAVTALVSAGLSPYAGASLPRVWPTLGGVAAYLWLHHWITQENQTSGRTGLITRALAGIGAVLTGVSLVGWIARPGAFSWSVRNDFPFGHSIQLAGAMLLLLPWLLHAAWGTRGWRRAGWLAAAATGTLVLLVTSSRSAALAAGIVAVTGTAWAVLRAGWSRRQQGLLVLAALAVLLVTVLANPRLRELAVRGTWSETARESNTQRSAMLEAGRLMGVDRPVTGWGPGTVPLVYPTLRHRLAAGVDNVLQLHSTPAQLWATLGLPGLTALALLLWAAARRGARLWRLTVPDSPALAAAAALAGYGLFALTDHQLDLPALNALLVVNAALLLAGGSAGSSSRGGPTFRLVAAGAVLLAGVIPLWPTLRDLAGRYRYHQTLILLANGRLAPALDRLASAARLAPHDPYYRHQAAGLLLSQHGATPGVAERAVLLDQAATELTASLAAGIFTEYAHFNLGWIALERADAAAANRHFRATLQESPHRRGAYFGLGLALRAAGREADAIRAFALEWLNDPAALTAPLWAWPAFAPLRPQVEAEANRMLDELAAGQPAAPYVRDLWRWWLHGGRPPAAGYNPETDRFVRTLAAVLDGSPLPAAAAPDPWDRLLRAWHAPEPGAAFLPFTPRQPGLAAALARRAARHPPPAVHDFLTSGIDEEPALLATERANRPGYGVLALHPDGPILIDLYVRQQNRLVSEFASTLFPPKGWIPAANLLTRLPPAP
ncbi:O-Antigen ligase [Lacunisphaera limnophila]|uniref:O-Antigen ligase n=1 Tax=Lacunisphaera limnophila TaxID=1838286 RepID=A0A1D8AUK3_9BACT|nr:O-antigen ligase family protein [Lacunisphaera limnophila]AOS44556.1 O-Antigen ligase [Lacunisphaera limnophila]